MIEGGVYDGKETLSFYENFNSELIAYCFEPYSDVLIDSPYYSSLKSKENFHHITKGLWDKNGQLYFHFNDSGSFVSEVSADKNTPKIDIASIDQFVRENSVEKVDFIKMDIEGAELNALRGAVNTIKKDRPQLAICIYHKKTDYYEIPLFLDQLLDNYEYRLGHYSCCNYESVWYGIPKELGLKCPS